MQRNPLSSQVDEISSGAYLVEIDYAPSSDTKGKLLKEGWVLPFQVNPNHDWYLAAFLKDDELDSV